MVYCTYNLFNMFQTLTCPSSGAPDYTCVVTACGVQGLGCRWSAVRSCSSSFPHPGRIACCPAPDRRPPATKALHTICGNNTSIVSSSWWWTYKCPKHVEQIISAINHSVASSWFSSIRIQIWILCIWKYLYVISLATITGLCVSKISYQYNVYRAFLILLNEKFLFLYNI